MSGAGETLGAECARFSAAASPASADEPSIAGAAETALRPVRLLLVSAASASGKTFVLRHLRGLPAFRDVRVFEMDELFYYAPERFAANLRKTAAAFEAWRRASPRSALRDELVENVEASENERRLIKQGLLALARGPRPVVTVRPQAMRWDPLAPRFFELLEAFFEIRIRHVLLHPTLPRYLANLIERSRRDFDSRWFVDRRRLHRDRRRFDAVFRPGLSTSIEEIERFFAEQLR